MVESAERFSLPKMNTTLFFELPRPQTTFALLFRRHRERQQKFLKGF